MDIKDQAIERIKNAAKAAANTLGTRLIFPQTNRKSSQVAQQDIDALIREWPGQLKAVIGSMIEKYGEPNEACGDRITWYSNAPWKTNGHST